MRKKQENDFEIEFDFEHDIDEILEEEEREQRRRAERRRSTQKKKSKKKQKKSVASGNLIAFLLILAVLVAAISFLTNSRSKDRNGAAGDPENPSGHGSITIVSESSEGNSQESGYSAATYEINTTIEANTDGFQVSDTMPETEEQAAPQVTDAPPVTAVVQPNLPVATAPQEFPNGETLVAPVPVQSGITMPSWITQNLLTVSPMHRPCLALDPVKNIVVHYVANPGSTAKGNHDYFEENSDGRQTSSHFIVGLQGEIIQCIPLNEVAYAQGSSQTAYNRNYDCISIENCHPDATGKFSSETYWALVKLCAWLCEQYGLPSDCLIRHYDVTGKACPAYYVDHEDEWIQFKETVRQFMIEHPDIASEMP